MFGLGTIVNCLAIVVGCGVGLVLKRGFPHAWQDAIMQGITLCIFVIGTKMALQSANIILVIASIVLGTIIGEILDIETALAHFGTWVETKIIGKRYEGTPGAIGEGFIAASLIYCVGAMAIVGSIQDGLTGDHQVLFAKSTLDGLTAIIFSANMGVGVGLAAASVFIYQGLITLLAVYMQSFLTAAVMTEITAAGGILIMAIAMKMSKLLDIPIANQIPALPVACLLAYFFQ